MLDITMGLHERKAMGVNRRMQAGDTGSSSIMEKLHFSGLLFNAISNIAEVGVEKHKYPDAYYNSVTALYNLWQFYIWGGGDQEPDHIFVKEMVALEKAHEDFINDLPKGDGSRVAYKNHDYKISMADGLFKAIMKSIGRQKMLPRKKRIIAI